MEEIFALIKAFNRLEERVVALTAKVDILVKSPFRKIVLDEKRLSEKAASFFIELLTDKTEY